MTDENLWRRCGSCKKPIALGAIYYACGIASCRKTSYCSMPCFDDHTPIFRHKDAWAEERKAPLVRDEELKDTNRLQTSRLVTPPSAKANEIPKDVLVVASKLKEYIRAKSGMNTSGNVLDRLSDMIRLQCDKAIERANSDSRKTVMDRDFYL